MEANLALSKINQSGHSTVGADVVLPIKHHSKSTLQPRSSTLLQFVELHCLEYCELQYPSEELRNVYTMERSESNSGETDKVKGGPCAQQFEWLESCARRKGLTNQKQQLQGCPSETDRLIKCINKNPLFFQGNK